jgi:hypothetical protein
MVSANGGKAWTSPPLGIAGFYSTGAAKVDGRRSADGAPAPPPGEPTGGAGPGTHRLESARLAQLLLPPDQRIRRRAKG